MAGDELIQIVDRAMAEAVRKSGAWLACRAGCCECCLGAFAITGADAERLRAGLAELERSDAARAARVRERARAAVERMGGGDLEARMGRVAEDEPCPALDGETGTCDLYGWRPVTCRIFGPAVRLGGEGVGICELCYVGASDEEIGRCEVRVELPEGEEDETLVALALVEEERQGRRP